MSGARNRKLREWTWFCGKVRRNRVRIRQWSDKSKVTEMTWHENGERQAVTLPYTDRTRAMMAAMAKAEELRLKRGPTAKPTDVIIAMRSDLNRVSRLLGLPEGVAPPREQYQQLGRYSVSAVLWAFKGGTKIGTYSHAWDSWSEVIHRFGLKTKNEVRRSVTREKIAVDLRRLAASLGNPNRMPSRKEYREHGRYSLCSVFRHMECRRWVEVAAKLHLDVGAWRLQQSENSKLRGKNGAVQS